MKSTPLQILRWALIVLLSAVLAYLVYAGAAGIVHLMARGEAGFVLVGGICMTLFLMGFMALFPAIMFYSLVTRKLYGFASCAGTIVALALFYGAMILPQKLEVLKFWTSGTSLPQPAMAISGMFVAIGLVILPFWILSRMIRLTNEWAYPRLFKPLEDKI